MAGRHRSEDRNPRPDTGYIGRHRSAPEGNRPLIGQPRPGEEILPGTFRSRPVKVKPAMAPARHGAGRQVGPVKSGGMGYRPGHAGTVRSQTKRDRAARRGKQEKAGNAVTKLFNALWQLGYR